MKKKHFKTICNSEIRVEHLEQAIEFINDGIVSGAYNYLAKDKKYDKKVAGIWKTRIDEGQICVVALHRGICVGMSHLDREHGRRAVNGYLAMTVKAGMQNKGIGQIVLTELEKNAKDKGLIRITAEPCEENQLAINFFIKMGYKEEGRIKKGFRTVDGKLINRLILGKIF